MCALPFGEEIGLELGGGGHLSFGLGDLAHQNLYMVLSLHLILQNKIIRNMSLYLIKCGRAEKHIRWSLWKDSVY